MRRLIVLCLVATTFAVPWARAETGGDASIHVSVTEDEHEKGTRICREAELATSVGSYTLRYEVVEDGGDTGHVEFAKWAPTKGYIPLGIVRPSMENWYNQGFILWTFDDLNLNSWKADCRVVRERGTDAVVEYVWDTPKVKAVARFAVVSGSDKLLLFARYEPKTDVTDIRFRLMVYPATFEKPWARTVTSAQRTVAKGAMDVDLERERWLLFENVHPDRPGKGSAGLLLGDATAFASVRASGIGGYAQYVDIQLAPGRRDFALGFYEYPSLPDYEQTRAYFKRTADAESDVLAQACASGADDLLPPMPIDEARRAQIAERDHEWLQRPAETWRPNPEPLPFPWAASLPGPPLKVAILAARWSALDTMELARRLEMDAEHQYFDKKDALVNPRSWPYRSTTGVHPLSKSAALRHAVRICADDARDLIFVGAIPGTALGARLRSVILSQVEAGKGLVITGGQDALAGWPAELTAQSDDSLVAEALAAAPWRRVPGLAPNGKPPVKAYRYGKGRVVVSRIVPSRYNAMIPRNSETYGLDGIDDRTLALHAAAFLAAANRPMTARPTLRVPDKPVPTGKRTEIPFEAPGGWTSALVRVQDDHDNVLALDTDCIDKERSMVLLPALPAMRTYYVDVALRNPSDECLGFASARLDVAPTHTLGEVLLSPANRNHPVAPPSVDLADGGLLKCACAVSPAPTGPLVLSWEIHDCVGRLLGHAEAPVAGNGSCKAEFKLPRAVVVPHGIDLTLLSGDLPIAVKHVPFTIPVPYDYNDFGILMWSYAGADLAVRLDNLLCYRMGSDMMDLCHMKGYDDVGAAREYAVAASSGQRIIPYVTRIAGKTIDGNRLSPGLYDKAWIKREKDSMEKCCRQAAPYAPPAYTLGDENYLARRGPEVDVAPETVAAFRTWLRTRYETIEDLNAAWATDYRSFDEIARPMLMEEAAMQSVSFAAWFDFRTFMEWAFVERHEDFAAFIHTQDPGALVGWDGLLRDHWQSGYDLDLMCRNLQLNQVYTTYIAQGEIVRSFKRPDALVGEWGNSIAGKEDGFSAIIWHNLFRGHNSCWWWTSWGCDYIPFNPDMSTSLMGQWYFEQARQVKAGPGRFLLHATRGNSGVAVLYNRADHFACALLPKMGDDAPTPNWLANTIGVTRTLEYLGLQYEFVSAAEIEADPACLDSYRALVLPYAMCMSEAVAEAARNLVNRGGFLIADGRPAMLTANGGPRTTRPLDDLFGVESAPGLEGFRRAVAPLDLGVEGVSLSALEPTLTLATATAGQQAGDTPLFMANSSGKGRALLMNVPFEAFGQLVKTEKLDTLLEPLGRAFTEAGIAPFAKVTGEGVEQVLFTDGANRYLALIQDLYRRELPEQQLSLAIDEPAYIYDVRAGKLLAGEPIARWETSISRGTPRLFALLPYRVRAIDVKIPPEATPGQNLPFKVSVLAHEDAPGYHVVHADVFAPGASAPHREYSRNFDCRLGQGGGDIPFALDDPPGEWHVVFTDAATGIKAEATLQLKPGA